MPFAHQPQVDPGSGLVDTEFPPVSESSPAIALRIPKDCPQCSQSAGIRLQTIRREGALQIQWDCVLCDQLWPVTRTDVMPATALTR